MRPFPLLVKPASADCNLRRRYCFYLDRCELYPDTPRHRMSEEVLEQMIRTYMATEQQQYSIGWQGGEPTLMGVDFYRKATEFQSKYGKPGCLVSNGLQTNGTLIDDELAGVLREYNFLVGVSVDGPEEVHNPNRPTVSGSGSHAAVMRGIECLKRHKVEYNVLTLVNSANVARPAETYKYLLDMGVLYHQYIECVEFDSQRNLMPFAITGEQWGDFLCTVYDQWYPADTRRVSVRLFDSILATMVDGVANTCSRGMDCRAYLVVEYNGDVYPCDFYVREDLKLGNIMTHSWQEMQDSPIYAEFGRRKREWNAACDVCRWKTHCAGDCPKNRMGHGEGDSRSLSELCSGWKMFYEHSASGFEKLAGEIRAERAESQRQFEMQQRMAAAPRARVGRNEACPCGSGRKFKKCCGRS